MKKTTKKTTKTVKPSQPTAKKVYTEADFFKVACMVFMCKTQLARLSAMIRCYFGDEMTKLEFLKEYMTADNEIKKLIKGFDEEIADISNKGHK